LRRLHREQQQQQGYDSREARTGIPSIRQTPDADHDHDDDEEYAYMQALGSFVIFRTGFTILNTRRMSKLSTQQRRNLLLTSKTIQLLLHYRPTTADGEDTKHLSSKEPWWDCMREWVRAHKHDIDDMIRRSSVRTRLASLLVLPARN
jgi:hypothetical protein